MPPKGYRRPPNESDAANGLKKCSRCEDTATVEAFSRNRSRRDGYAEWCRACVKTWRYPHEDRYRARTRAYYKTKRGLEINRKWSRHHKVTFPEKRAAHTAVRNAVRRGDLTKPTVCEFCAAGGRIEGHHYAGYGPAQQLLVKWLCKPCHVEADRLAEGLIDGFLALAGVA